MPGASTDKAVGLLPFLPLYFFSDIKPDNVYLACSDGVPVRAALGDWGAATMLEEDEEKSSPM